LDRKGFVSCFLGWKADALIGADKVDIVSEFSADSDKGNSDTISTLSAPINASPFHPRKQLTNPFLSDQCRVASTEPSYGVY
jgi:hypothetical protein